jgi:hypothetical protein
MDQGERLYYEVKGELPIYKKDNGFIFTTVEVEVRYQDDDEILLDNLPEDTKTLEEILCITSNNTQKDGYFTCNVDLYEYLCHVSCCMRMYGWRKSKNDEHVTPTFLEALQNMEYQRLGSVNILGTKMGLGIEEVDKRLAMKSIEWITSVDSNQESGQSYVMSLRNASVSTQITPDSNQSCFMVESSQVPLVASLPKAFQSNLGQETQDGGEFAGELGEEQEQTIKLESIRNTKYSDMYRFTNDKGDELIWFTSSCPDMEEGQTYRCSFKIKDHSTYNGRKQTKINYVKLVT